MASSTSFSARDAHKRCVPHCIGAFNIIMQWRNDRLLIALLVLSYQLYVAASLNICAIHLKHFLKHGYFIVAMAISKIFDLFDFCYLVFHECIFQQYKDKCVLCTNIVYNSIFVIDYDKIIIWSTSEEPAEQSEHSFCLVQSYLKGIYLKCSLYSTP